MIVHMGAHKVNWILDEENGDWQGTGEHASYVVHQLTTQPTGEPEQKGKFYIARRLGQNPLKVIGGPYNTVREAKARADIVEASL